MRNTQRIAALGLLLGAITTTGHAETLVLYDVDFSTPPHVLGAAPTTGAGAIPRDTVSNVPAGTPVVVAAEGQLVDQPLLFDAFDGSADRINFDLTDVPSSSFYFFEAQILVTVAAQEGGMVVFFNTPASRAVIFDGEGEVRASRPGQATSIGRYTPGVPLVLQVAVDLTLDTWRIYLDEVLVHEDSFGGATALQAIAVSTDLDPNPEPSTGAIDDVLILGGMDGDCERLGFGDLVAGSVWNEGDSFTTEGVVVTVGPHPFDPALGCAGPTVSGFTEVVVGGDNCGAGNQLEVNNVTVDFDFGGPVREVVIPYGEHGGTVSLSVNGDCVVVEDFPEISGTTLGGVAVTVFDFGGGPEGCGVIRLGGVVEQLSVSGQEFFIDGLSYCLDCPDFVRSALDDQTSGDEYSVGDSFTSGAATHTLQDFYPPGATCVNPASDGVARIQSSSIACGGGLEVNLNNINDRIDFGGPVSWIVLNYGEFGGNVNLEVNGDCRNLNNLSDVNGTQVGGVTVWAVDYGDPGQSCGALYAVGEIEDFIIGGQEFGIDFIRSCPPSSAGVEETSRLASGLVLEPNQPNPMQAWTTLRFALSESSPVKLTVFDVNGRLVRTLADQELAAGAYEMIWDGRDNDGRMLPSGIYLYRVDAGSRSASRRLILVQ